MDAATVVVMLAVHLLGSGALLGVVAWRLPDQPALRGWAAAALLMGLGYVGRLVDGLQQLSTLSIWADLAMVLAQLLFIAGVDEFVHHRRRLKQALVAAAALCALQLGVSLVMGVHARFVLLNGVMGLLYLVMCAAALDGARRFEAGSGVRHSLVALGGLVGVLGLLTCVRAAQIQLHGVDTMYAGWFAGLFYAYGSFVGVVVSLLLLWNVFEGMSLTLRRLARHDPLTDVLNRAGLREAIERHFDHPGARPLTLLAVDIDHFKRVNDEHGHGVGDAVLRLVARTLSEQLGPNEFIARTGGEEFLLGHVGAYGRPALALAELCRGAVSALRCTGRRGATLSCTVSVGVSSLVHDAAQWERAAGEADRALYAAKAGGRNRSEAFDEDHHTAPADLYVA